MKKIIFWIIGLIVVVGGVLLVLNALTCNQEKKIAALEQKIEHIKAVQVPMRFKITERKSDSFTVAVKFYSADGDEIKRIEKNYPGSELSLDFVEFPVKDRFIAFPYKMYSDEIAPDNGDILFSFYDKKGFPQIFHYKGIDKKLSDGLSSLFERIKSNKLRPEDVYFGNMVHDLKGIKNYEEGEVYKVIVHTKGGIEVVVN